MIAPRIGLNEALFSRESSSAPMTTPTAAAGQVPAAGQAEVGLPQNAIPVALLFFNVGVEIAQVAFIVTVLQLIAAVRRIRIAPPTWAWRIPPYAIGSLAAYWFLQRLAKF